MREREAVKQFLYLLINLTRRNVLVWKTYWTRDFAVIFEDWRFASHVVVGGFHRLEILNRWGQEQKILHTTEGKAALLKELRGEIEKQFNKRKDTEQELKDAVETVGKLVKSLIKKPS